MPTVDELLNASNEVTTCTVNPDTREIIVPEKYKVLGVFSDEKVTKIPFTCPKVVGNNVDLTEYNLYINYQNASGMSNAYLIEDVAESGDNITFSWLLSRYVTFSPGVVKYSLCAKKLDGDTISNEWNTTITTGLVIQGLEATREIIEENPDIIEALISKAHTHENKSVLDKFAELNGSPTYNGEPIGGGSVGGITAEDVTYTYPNTDWVNAKDAFDGIIASFNVLAGQIDGPIQSAHTHDNKSVIDKLSVAGDKLQYNGSDVGLKGDKGDKGDAGAAGADGYTPVKGTDYWTAADKAEIVEELKPSQVTSGTSITLADNTEYRLTDVTELSITYPDGNFECWMRLSFAASGTIMVTLPSTTQYIGTTPTFANGETWEMSIKDGIVIAGKVA